MGNKERAREFKRSEDEKQRRAAEAATLERITTQPRDATEDVWLGRSSGTRRLQLIELPSFEVARAWEVRKVQQGDWLLFGSDVVACGPIQLKGWRRLAVDSATLQSFYEQVTALHLPLGPPPGAFGGADGTVMQLAAFSGYAHAEWRFQWWSHYPPGWKPLVEIAEAMLLVFTAVDSPPKETSSN